MEKLRKGNVYMRHVEGTSRIVPLQMQRGKQEQMRANIVTFLTWAPFQNENRKFETN